MFVGGTKTPTTLVATVGIIHRVTWTDSEACVFTLAAWKLSALRCFAEFAKSRLLSLSLLLLFCVFVAS